MAASTTVAVDWNLFSDLDLQLIYESIIDFDDRLQCKIWYLEDMARKDVRAEQLAGDAQLYSMYRAMQDRLPSMKHEIEKVLRRRRLPCRP